MPLSCFEQQQSRTWLRGGLEKVVYQARRGARGQRLACGLLAVGSPQTSVSLSGTRSTCARGPPRSILSDSCRRLSFSESQNSGCLGVDFFLLKFHFGTLFAIFGESGTLQGRVRAVAQWESRDLQVSGTGSVPGTAKQTKEKQTEPFWAIIRFLFS